MSSKLKWTLAVLSVCGLLAAAGFLMFHASELSPGYVKLHAYLDDASGLMDGTQVRLDGIPIGYLDAQKLTGSRNPRRKVEFDLKVKEHFLRDIPVDSAVSLASDNLLGEQYIGIRRGHSPQHVQAGAELGSNLAEDITKIMAQMSLQLDRLQSIFTRAEKLMSGVGTGQGRDRQDRAESAGGRRIPGRTQSADGRRATWQRHDDETAVRRPAGRAATGAAEETERGDGDGGRVIGQDEGVPGRPGRAPPGNFRRCRPS